MNFPWGGPKILGEKGTFLKEQCIFPKERPKFPRNICFKSFCNHSHLISNFIIYCDLSLERFQGEIQLCSWKYFNHNSYAKIMIKQNFKHICSLGQLKLLFPRGHDCFPRKKGLSYSLGQLKLLPRDMIVP